MPTYLQQLHIGSDRHLEQKFHHQWFRNEWLHQSRWHKQHQQTCDDEGRWSLIACCFMMEPRKMRPSHLSMHREQHLDDGACPENQRIEVAFQVHSIREIQPGFKCFNFSCKRVFRSFSRDSRLRRIHDEIIHVVPFVTLLWRFLSTQILLVLVSLWSQLHSSNEVHAGQRDRCSFPKKVIHRNFLRESSALNQVQRLHVLLPLDRLMKFVRFDFSAVRQHPLTISMFQGGPPLYSS